MITHPDFQRFTFKMSSEESESDTEPCNKKSRSIIWEYFTKLPDGSKNEKSAKCNTCLVHVKMPTSSTSGLIRHLPKHPAINLKYLKEKSVKRSSSTTPKSASQPTISSLFEKQSALPTTSARHKEITRAIAIMMALDFEPYYMVTHKGFLNLLKVIKHIIYPVGLLTLIFRLGCALNTTSTARIVRYRQTTKNLDLVSKSRPKI